MFRTDLNHWLQSFESTPLTSFMEGVSFLGNIYPIMLITLVVLGSIDLKKGWLLLNIVAFTAFLTVWAKEVIDYPRPYAVDPKLISFDNNQTQNDLTLLQPVGFFDVFSDELLSQTRKSEIGRLGFPSGHTSIQIAMWIGIALIFLHRALWIWGITFVTLTMWSRMYLGVHYLGDIIGGLILGLAVTLSIYKLGTYALKKGGNVLIAFCFLIVIPWALCDTDASWQAGLLVGANLALWMHLIQRKELTHVNSLTRILSGLTLAILYLSFFFGARYATLALPTLKLLWFAMAGFGSLSIHLTIARKTRWLIPQ
jgi:membrane-associated phospholipid phosphatase